MRSEESTSQHRGGDDPQQPQTLTIAEAAQVCGLSTSTIRRYLRDGRFPGARQAPSPVPGQPRQWRIPADDVSKAGLSTSTIRRYLRDGRFPGARQAPSPVPGQPRQWRIPTDDVLKAGLARQQPTPSGHAAQHQAAADSAGTWADRDRVQALEHALELERTRRQAAEALAAERARTIVTLETALRAVEHRRPQPAPDQAATTTVASSWSGGGQAPGPARSPGILQMVPRPRRSKGELSQEERAAIIGRALSGQRPPKRRWGWW